MLVDLFSTSLMRLQLEIAFRLGTTVTRSEGTNGGKDGTNRCLDQKKLPEVQTVYGLSIRP